MGTIPSAPHHEAQLSRAPDHEEAKHHVVDYAERYLEYRNRYERTLVKTKDGLVGGDHEITSAWSVVEAHMNRLLERLYKQNVKLGLDVTVGNSEMLQSKPPVTDTDVTVATTIRFQLPGEPIPEYHDEYIVVLPLSEDLGRGRKYDL